MVARRVSVAMLATAGLLGAVWAAQSNADGQASSRPSAKALAGDAAGEGEHMDQSGDSAWLENVWQSCTCPQKPCSLAGSDLLVLPGCLARKLLDPSAQLGQGPVGLAVFAVFLAVLTRQTVKGSRESWRLAFALFLILFLGTTIFSSFDVLPGFFQSPFDLVNFVLIFVASAFLAGVFAFWTRYMLDLLAVIGGAALAAQLAASMEEESMRMLLIVVVGMAGGVWLHWWRDHRQKPPPAPVGKQGQPASHRTADAKVSKEKASD